MTKQAPEYVKHNHKLMIFIGLLFAILEAYNARFNNTSYISIALIFAGGLTIGVAIVRLKVINLEMNSKEKRV